VVSDIYDLIVIGNGAAASAFAYPCREAGWRVAVIDHRPLGGTRALRAAIRRRCWSAHRRRSITQGGSPVRASPASCGSTGRR
jgi:pyruvate/2-oxoglutarate dehydrogenase complex dihydrolipoamide dehydrogenase (E3) component